MEPRNKIYRKNILANVGIRTQKYVTRVQACFNCYLCSKLEQDNSSKQTYDSLKAKTKWTTNASFDKTQCLHQLSVRKESILGYFRSFQESKVIEIIFQQACSLLSQKSNS